MKQPHNNEIPVLWVNPPDVKDTKQALTQTFLLTYKGQAHAQRKTQNGGSFCKSIVVTLHFADTFRTGDLHLHCLLKT